MSWNNEHYEMLKNILWVFLGLAVGSFVNMGIITIGPNFVPPPAGVDVTNLESMQAGAHLFEAKHFSVSMAGSCCRHFCRGIGCGFACANLSQTTCFVGSGYFSGGRSDDGLLVSVTNLVYGRRHWFGLYSNGAFKPQIG